MEFKPVSHVLFDMDGLILNTEDLYTEAFQNVLSKYGKIYTFELKLKLMGLQAHETANSIVSALDLPMTPEEFMTETQKQFEILFQDTKVLPGARRLIEHLHNKNIPIGLATSSGEESYHLKVDKHHQDLFALFPYKTFGSSDLNVKCGKPFPDIFLVAAAKFPDNPEPEKVSVTNHLISFYNQQDIFLVAAAKFPDNPEPEQCLVLEDAVNGVMAAKAAGMQVVMVPDQRIDKSLTTEATLVLNSLEEFRPELFGLPPFEDFHSNIK